MHARAPQAAAIFLKNVFVAEDEERMADNVNGADDNILSSHFHLKRLCLDTNPVCLFPICFIAIFASEIFHGPVYWTCFLAHVFPSVSTVMYCSAEGRHS